MYQSLTYPHPIDIVTAMSDEARKRTSAENIADVLLALASAGMQGHAHGKHPVVLKHHREKRVYIAGPMTGYPEHNFPAFNAKAEVLRSAGWHVENPADHGVVDGAEWNDYLRVDISRLSTCSTIHLLPNWLYSVGARLEVYIALALGMDVQYALGAQDVSMHPDFRR